MCSMAQQPDCWKLRQSRKNPKISCQIILGKQHKTYEEALEKIDLQPLNERRDELCLNFAKKCLKSEKVRDMFPVNEKSHKMDLRKTEQYVVNHANTERLKMSAIPYMQRLLNTDCQDKW